MNRSDLLPFARRRMPLPWQPVPSSLVGPFATIYRDAEFLIPFWNLKNPFNSGYPKDLSLHTNARSNYFNVNGHTVQTGPINMGLRINDNQNAATTNTATTTPASRSIMVVFTMLAWPSSGYKMLWGMQTGGAWLCNVGVSPNGDLLYYEVTGGAVNLFSPTGVITRGQQHAVVCVSDNSAGMRIYCDGRLVATNGSTGFLTLSGLNLATNQAPSPWTGNVADYVVHLGGWWPVALSSHHAAALSADGFGLVRPASRLALPFDPAAGGGGGGGGSHRRWVAIAA